MLSEDELERVCVVLVRARNPNNIGAVARAMHDFGFRRLRVVNEFPVPLEAAKSAVDAGAVIAAAETCTSVGEAVRDCTLVIGTTAVGERDVQHEVVTLADAAPRIVAAVRGAGRVAVLFGSEKTGLSNEELSHCDWLLTIPMSRHAGVRHASMNLGQAAAVCLYELVRREGASAPEPVPVPVRRDVPPGVEVERLTALLAEVLEESGYRKHHPANSEVADTRRLVRRLAGRSGMDAQDAAVCLGMLRQVLWKVRGDTSAVEKRS